MTAAANTTAVLVPLKSFAAAKGRLGTSLTENEREDLMRTLAAGVLAAARDFPRFVVCNSRAVAEFALTHDAQVIWRGGGLSPAVQAAVDQLDHEGVRRVIVTHGDLASPDGFETFDRTDNRVIVGTDRHADGSNIVSIPTGTGFRFAYGVGSMRKHADEAARLDLPCEIINDTMGLDVDTPEDLALYLEDHRSDERSTP